MRTKGHMEEVFEGEVFYIANHVFLQLKEIASASGYDPRGIKLNTKTDALDKGIGRVDAYITWLEGPEDWTTMCELPTDFCCVYDSSMLIFYD